MTKTEELLKKFGDQCEARGVAIGEARSIAIGEARGVAIGEAKGVDEMLLFFQESIEAMKTVNAEAVKAMLAKAEEKLQLIKAAAEKSVYFQQCGSDG